MNQTAKAELREIIMRELHPFMCSDHVDRCIGYPDHKREVDETVNQIISAILDVKPEKIDWTEKTFVHLPPYRRAKAKTAMTNYNRALDDWEQAIKGGPQ